MNSELMQVQLCLQIQSRMNMPGKTIFYHNVTYYVDLQSYMMNFIVSLTSLSSPHFDIRI